jgi:hypothetical protein
MGDLPLASSCYTIPMEGTTGKHPQRPASELPPALFLDRLSG